jgi:FlaA1/EpsC-like NDP-sugar epimerase
MEKLFQAQQEGPCTFTLVRYGNVVASNGSVIPIWRDQAARGELLTVTNPDMTRFWMAPSEAVRLVCNAATLTAGQILVPAMGALSLLQMAAIVAPEAKTTTIGLRSCEKVHEELFHADEPVCATMDDHDYLIVAEDHPYSTKGGHYPSNKAHWITPDQFLAMLEEAESYA